MINISPRGRYEIAISNRPPAMTGRLGDNITEDPIDTLASFLSTVSPAPTSFMSLGSSSSTLTLESMTEALSVMNRTVPDRERGRPIRTQEDLYREVSDRQLHRALFEDFQRTMTMRINDAETQEREVRDGERSSDERTDD